MRMFQFHLQKVLDMKEKKREQVEWNYALQSKLVNKQKEELQDLINSKAEAQQSLIDTQLVGTSITKIHQMNEYIGFLDHLIDQQKKNLQHAEKELSEQHVQLKESKVEEKVWSNLKEKKWEQFKIESNQIEQKELDEIVSQRSVK